MTSEVSTYSSLEDPQLQDSRVNRIGEGLGGIDGASKSARCCRIECEAGVTTGPRACAIDTKGDVSACCKAGDNEIVTSEGHGSKACQSRLQRVGDVLRRLRHDIEGRELDSAEEVSYELIGNVGSITDEVSVKDGEDSGPKRDRQRVLGPQHSVDVSAGGHDGRAEPGIRDFTARPDVDRGARGIDGEEFGPNGRGGRTRSGRGEINVAAGLQDLDDVVVERREGGVVLTDQDESPATQHVVRELGADARRHAIRVEHS